MKLQWFLLFVLVAFASRCFAADDDLMEKYAKRCYTGHIESIKKAQEKIAFYEDLLVSIKADKSLKAGNRREQLENNRKLAEEAEAKLVELLNPCTPFPASSHPSAVTVGAVVRLKCMASVEDIASKEEAIVSLKWYETVDVVRHTQNGTPYHTSQNNDYEKRVWLSGVDTSTFTSGKFIEMDGFYHSPRSETYDTVAGGQITIPVIVPVEIDGTDPRLSLWPRIAREWAIKDKEPVKAAIGNYERGAVVLHYEDGETVEVKLSDLSADDRKYVKEWRAENGR